jgi:hypothetical protein
VKESAKYVLTLFAFVAGAFVVSWCAVYSFWIGAHVFHSVEAVRTGDAIAHVILAPARTLLRTGSDALEQSTLLTNPLVYAQINAAIIGIVAYAICRRFIFKHKGGG